MWLQAVAIALPRVQFHYAVQSSSIGYLSASIFLGMMLGAVSPSQRIQTFLTDRHSFCGGPVSGVPTSRARLD